jgi:transcriptional regulator of arginine metabolism
MNKEMRMQQIKQLISEQEVKTQEELQHLLFKKGLTVTQATISRDIHTLKLIKVQTKDGSLKYSSKIEEENLISDKLNSTKLKRKLMEDLVSLEVIEYFVLLKTLPGNAHSFGALLDSIELEGKAGTICGNDTCLIICRSRESATRIKEQMEGFINDLD